MKTLKGLYLEEVEFVLENMGRDSLITIKKEASNDSFSVSFEDEILYRKIEDLLYYSQKDYQHDDDDNSKYHQYYDDDDFDN
jgi:hypothetical protein